MRGYTTLRQQAIIVQFVTDGQVTATKEVVQNVYMSYSKVPHVQFQKMIRRVRLDPTSGFYILVMEA